MGFKQYLRKLKAEHDKKFPTPPLDGNFDGRIIFAEDESAFFQCHQVISYEDFEGVSREDAWYYSVCSAEEIKRILMVKNASDYLLKLRADEIADNARFHRVFLKRKKGIAEWSITSFFNNTIFNDYIELLPNSMHKKCKNVTSGFAYLKEPVGKCIKTEFGNIIVISESLRYFLYYMNLFMYSKQFSIQPKDAFYSFMIAIRVMLENEALDFDLDPRGVLPNSIHSFLERTVSYQMKFVVGHEYAHHILGHLDKSWLNQCQISDIAYITKNDHQTKVYNYSQKQEFEADWYSIKNARYSPVEKGEVVNAAFLFFQALDLFQFVKQFFSPDSSRYKTHPEPIERLLKLRKRINKRHGSTSEEIEQSRAYMDKFKSYLVKEVLPFNSDSFEFYGSMYLPSFKKAKLIDRIDY